MSLRKLFGMDKVESREAERDRVRAAAEKQAEEQRQKERAQLLTLIEHVDKEIEPLLDHNELRVHRLANFKSGNLSNRPLVALRSILAEKQAKLAVAQEKMKPAAEPVQEVEALRILADKKHARSLSIVEEMAAKTGNCDPLIEIIVAVLGRRGINPVEALEEIMTDKAIEEKSPELVALEALAKDISDHWGGVDYELEPDRFTLGTGMALTTWRPNPEEGKSNWAKKGHIGGEEFIGARAYMGKRGAIICVFKPVAAETYATMEMPLQEAFQNLNDFQRSFVENGFAVKLAAITNAKAEKARAAELSEHIGKYSDFGSF